MQKLQVFANDEAKMLQIRVCFDILDIDRDGHLNILNLLHLYRNLNKDTILCREIFRVIDYYLKKNVNCKVD